MSLIKKKTFNSQVERDLKSFKEKSDIIVANRQVEDLVDVQKSIYDLFGSD